MPVIIMREKLVTLNSNFVSGRPFGCQRSNLIATLLMKHWFLASWRMIGVGVPLSRTFHPLSPTQCSTGVYGVWCCSTYPGKLVLPWILLLTSCVQGFVDMVSQVLVELQDAFTYTSDPPGPLMSS